jgi:hypothetical protein
MNLEYENSQFDIDEVIRIWQETLLDGFISSQFMYGHPGWWVPEKEEPVKERDPNLIDCDRCGSTGESLVWDSDTRMMKPKKGGCVWCEGTGYIMKDPSQKPTTKFNASEWSIDPNLPPIDMYNWATGKKK